MPTADGRIKGISLSGVSIPWHVPACWCCDRPAPARKPDPWEGRMDGYCEACALARCDAYPGDCGPMNSGYPV